MTQSPLAVSMGDPCGIGPDIILSAWQTRDVLRLPNFIVVGSADLLERRSAMMGHTTKVKAIGSLSDQSQDALCVLDVGIDVRGAPGEALENDAKATVAAIDNAVDLVAKGECAAVVTCPINKDVLYQCGFKHPGHTEYLAELAQQHFGSTHRSVMMIAGPELKTIPVTIHIPLAEVASSLTQELIVETIEITHHDLKKRFGIPSPRIAVAGLNPHAGERGQLGHEEIETIIPALETLRKAGIETVGPLPADTMFHAAARKRYDVAVCMYHDQALIPAKMIGFDDGVNVTLGLPFIRTSPDHGTAYDIAGSGKADCSSFTAALKMAHRMAVES